MSEQVDAPLDVDATDADVVDADATDEIVLDELGLDDAPTEDPAVATGPAGETEVLCPGCGLTLVGEGPRRASADWFCPRCDYPLFWATEPEPDARPATRAARRRLPGSGGRVRPGAEPCWHCGELDEPGDAECRRCAAVLPKPLAPVVEVDKEVPVPVPVLLRPVVWPFVAAAACAGIAIAMALTIWLTGGGG